MSKKNNMNARIAGIVSRTRMRQSAIKILCIFDVIRGHVLRFLAMLLHFTHLPRTQVIQTLVGIVVKSFQDPEYHHLLLMVPRLLLQQSRIGISELSIYKKCISLGSVTMQRSFSEQIISDNI
jgi:hypothetical protein